MLIQDFCIADRYRLVRLIGKGGFCLVFEVDLDTQEAVAVKLEHVSAEPSSLTSEVCAYSMLSGETCVPALRWCGTECEYKAIVFDLLGPSLEDLFNHCGRKFSPKTGLALADQLISSLERLHSKHVIHRDVKPENVLVDLDGSANRIYVADLCLALYEHAAAAARGGALVGTPRFASINAHLGKGQSPVDDMESLAYVLMYFLRGSLPRQGFQTSSRDDRDHLILEKKKRTSTEELCGGLPVEFANFVVYIRTLGPGGKPDYAYLRELFRRLYCRAGFERDQVFD